MGIVITGIGWVLLVTGLIVGLGAGLLLLVAAFGAGLIWGLIYVFIPFGKLLFIITHWEDSKYLFLTSVAGGALAVVGIVMLAGVGAADFVEATRVEMARQEAEFEAYEEEYGYDAEGWPEEEAEFPGESMAASNMTAPAQGIAAAAEVAPPSAPPAPQAAASAPEPAAVVASPPEPQRPTGPTNFQIARNLSEQANQALESDNLEEAVSYAEAAHTRYLRTLGPNHPITRKAKIRAAELKKQMSDRLLSAP